MKRIWVRVDPWDKELAIAARESGADAVVVAEGDSPKVKELGTLATVAPDGDIKPDVDAVWLDIRNKADEEAAATTHLDKMVVLRTHDWTVIPVENLVSRRGGLMAEVNGSRRGTAGHPGTGEGRGRSRAVHALVRGDPQDGSADSFAVAKAGARACGDHWDPPAGHGGQSLC